MVFERVEMFNEEIATAHRGDARAAGEGGHQDRLGALGHSNERITRDLYQHVSVQMQIGAAERVVALLPARPAKPAAKA